MRLLILICWLILGLTFLNQMQVVRGDDVLKQKVQQEYPNALVKLDARYGTMYGRARYHGNLITRNGPGPDDDLYLDFAFTPGMAKMSRTMILQQSGAKPTKNNVYQKISGVNKNYVFSLSRQNPGDELVITNITEDLVRGQSSASIAHSGQVHCALSLGSSSILAFSQLKMLQVDSVIKVGEGAGPNQLLLRFHIVRKAEKSKPTTNSRDVAGWLVVDPEEGWILREYGQIDSYNGEAAATMIGKIDYARSPDGHLDPVKLIEQAYLGRVDRNPTSPARGSFSLTFESVKYEALPESEFHLPAFGLPEVEAPGKKGASLGQPYGIFALAGIGFGVAGGVKYLAGRLKRA